MHNGQRSTGLIAAVPLEYITDFLSLEDEGQLMYYHIIRPDGSFVIQNPNSELWYFFEQLQNQPDSAANESSSGNPVKALGAALKNHQEYAATLDVNGEERQVYGISLPYSCLLYTSSPMEVQEGVYVRPLQGFPCRHGKQLRPAQPFVEFLIEGKGVLNL